MTHEEKQILIGITQLVRDLTVKVDSLEAALIHRNLLRDSERGNYAPSYYQAANQDVALILAQIATLP
jgi:hypothetical protein